MNKRLASFVERASERLGRSAGFFLAVLIVLCGVEVAVDWNSTLYEINVLRAQLKQKAENYADLLRKAAEPAILGYDAEELGRLSSGMFDDDELVYVRFTDLLGNTLYDRLRPDYARSFAEAHNETFRDRYRRLMARDAAGIANDPVGLRRRMESSRHRDFIQAFTDGENALFAKFSAPQQKGVEPPPRVLYQDRLSEVGGARDRDTSYSVGAITATDGEVYGVVLVAFRLDKLNRAVLGKLGKGLGIVLFFVGLILVQNVASRKAKLRLMHLEAAQKASREAVRATLPSLPGIAWGQAGVALRQAERVGGTIYDLRVDDHGALELLVAVPEGDGVEAAFASVALLDCYRGLPGASSAAERAAALLAAYDQSPLGRPIELMILKVEAGGAVEGVCAGLSPPAVIADGGADGEVRQIVAGEPLPLQARRLRAPLRPFHCAIGSLILAPSPATVATLLTEGAAPQKAAERALAAKKKKDGDDDFVFVLRAGPQNL